VRDGDERVPFIQEFMDTARAQCFGNLSGIRRAGG
jgi:LysR family transcriptional regulator for metE and metH